MGKYLFQASYTQAGLTGLLKEGGTQRRAALAQTIEGPAARWSHFTMHSGRATST